MTVLIVDDDKLVCAAIKVLLEATPGVAVSGIGHDGYEAVALFRRLKPDVLLMDIQMKNCSGLDAAETILKEVVNARILLLTTFSDDEYIIRALKIGAKGYILKQNFDCIVPSLQAVCAGQCVYGDEISTKIPMLLSGGSFTTYAAFGILDKEYEVIEQIAKGRNNREIALALHLSDGTVRNYISSILEKLQLRDRTQLAVFYFRGQVAGSEKRLL